MRILHYTLGLPPVRSGGLTKYAVDLMGKQTNNDTVIHLYPGNIDLLNRRTRIAHNKTTSGIDHYTIINSLPLPLFRGIKEPDDFMGKGPYEEYLSFLKKVKPDVIHIHTLMGIHQEFFDTAKQLHIKMVYTTHDYFGICPTINLYKDRENVNCENFNNGLGCLECCANAMSTKSLLLTQTPLYPMIRKLKKLKPSRENKRLDISPIKNTEPLEPMVAEKYVKLRHFYLEMFNKIDFFHFNSTVAEEIFKSYLPGIKGRVIDITHSGIHEVDSEKTGDSIIRVGYLGPLKDYKGFFLLLDAFKQLPSNKYELHLYGDEGDLDLPANVYLHGRYSTNELEKIFASMDVLVVPSIWKETFGFVALEGLSHSTPIIVSDSVGSKDLVNDEFGWRISGNSLVELVNVLSRLTKEELYKKHINIRKHFRVSTLEEHSNSIKDKIYKYLENNY